MSVGSVEKPDKAVTVLVVDDNFQNREVAEGHLVGAGYQAIQAESGAQALELLEARRPDLVLLDVLMPGMDGFETCRQIRMLPIVGDTPVLFLTALGDLGTHKQALDSGADDFLTKPINRTELLIRVRSLLRIKSLSDELKQQYDVIRVQRDALLAAHRQKEELTALIVHDLKNPLSSILSNAKYVLGRQELGVDERDSLEDVLRASQSMVRLVMNLLDVSRSEDGALVPQVSEFHLPTLLGEVAKEMGRRVEDKDQRITLAVSPAVRDLRGDRDLVRRILENLIDNAYKYGPRHTMIAIEVLPATMDDGGEAAVEIRVRDEGEGIPTAYRQLIFEKYGRVNGHGGDAGRASHGLGLVFCRRAVSVHGGAIWVEDRASNMMGTLGGSPNPPATDSAGQSPASSARRGGCFCVRLPVARLALTATAGPASVVSSAASSVASPAGPTRAPVGMATR